jgi:hypothetical protein
MLSTAFRFLAGSRIGLVSLSLFICIISLLLPAFCNGYPLLNEDTATYPYSGKEGFLPADRPYYYGLFVRHVSLNYSLWFVLIVHGLAVYRIVLLFFRKLFESSFLKATAYTTIVIVLLSFASSLGVFTSYISKHCPDAPADLCEADSIPQSAVYFIWNSASPVYKQCPVPSKETENEPIYTCFRYKNPIYKKTLWKMMRSDMGPTIAKQFGKDCIRQLLLYKSEDQFFDSLKKRMNKGVYSHIQFIFPDDVKQAERSKQFNGAIDFTLLNYASLVLLLLSCLAGIVMLFYFPLSRKLYFHLFAFLVANAAVCGCLSDVLNRYQSRIAWLLPFFACTLFMEAFEHYRNRSSPNKEPAHRPA